MRLIIRTILDPVTEHLLVQTLARTSRKVNGGVTGRAAVLLVRSVPTVHESIASLRRFEARSLVSTVKEPFTQGARRAIGLIRLIVAIKVSIATLLARNTKSVRTSKLVLFQTTNLFIRVFFDALEDGRRVRTRGEGTTQLSGARAMSATPARVVSVPDELARGFRWSIATRDVNSENANLEVSATPFAWIARDFFEGADTVLDLEGQESGAEHG